MQPLVEKSPLRALLFSSRSVAALGAIGVSCIVIPGQYPLWSNGEKDRLCARITPVLAEGRFDGGQSPAAALRALTPGMLGVLDKLTALPPQAQLGRIFETEGALHYDAFFHSFALAAIRDPRAMPPADAFTTIKPKSEEIPDRQRLEIFELLSTNALAAAQPALASEILAHACRTSVSTFATVKDMISASRLAGTQPPVMEEFRKWMRKRIGSLDAGQRIEAGLLHYTLAVEAGLPSEALDECLDELKRLPGMSSVPSELMERTHRAAVLAERTKELLPWLESYLASFPHASLAWEDLASAAPSEPYKTWVRRAADIADGHLLADKAYAHHQRLLAMGDTAGLDRFLPLSAQLGRSEEAAQLIASVARRPGNEKLHLQSARVIALNGRPDQAAGMIEAWVAKHPEDRAAAFELACMKQTGGDLAACIAAFEMFLRSFPADAEAVKKLAALRIRNAQPQSALRELDGLAETDFDAATLENYALLAESLDRPGSLQRALRISSSHPSKATPALYLRMSEIARQHQQNQEAPLMVLREGIKRLPQSPSLRARLAALLLEQENFDEALTEALHPVVRTRQDALALALAAAVHTQRCAEVLAVVGPDFEKNHDLTAATRLDLAAACCITGDAKRGDELFASVRPDGANFARLAAAHLRAGHAEQAEIFARQNIAQSTTPKPADWILLGDAQSASGRAADANDAYAKALSVVRAKISNHNAAAPVAASATTAQTNHHQ